MGRKSDFPKVNQTGLTENSGNFVTIEEMRCRDLFTKENQNESKQRCMMLFTTEQNAVS
jgi:hypothetical protein